MLTRARVVTWCLATVIGCGPKPAPAPAPAPPPPTLDTRALAAELDGELAEVAVVLRRDRADCRALAAGLRAVFARLTASLARTREAQRDPAVATRMTTDLKAYDQITVKRTEAISAELTPDAPCLRDPEVRDVMMSMPTL